MSLGDFFHMGGYGLYVWGAYGMAVLLMALEVWWLRQRRRTIVRRLGRINRMSADKGRT